MNTSEGAIRPEALLAHADWVRRLAQSLVFEPDRVEDVVQETWLTALRKPPGDDGNLRSWLGGVVENVARSTGRSDTRRRRREAAAARAEVLPATAELVEQASLQRELVGQVLRLEEPYRSVLLLRFFEDLAPRHIAKRLDMPVDTVKTQLQRGLELLRRRLDRTYGDRRAWCIAFLPLAHAKKSSLLLGKLGGASATKVAGAIVLGLFVIAVVRQSVNWVSAAAQTKSTRNEQDAIAADPSFGNHATQRGTREPEDEPLDSKRSAQPAPPATGGAGGALLIRGRVVGLDAQPLAGLLLRWDDPRAVHWASPEERLIVGPSYYLEVDPETRQRLQGAPAELEAFVQSYFSSPEVGRALILGEPVPELTFRTGSDGSFEVNAPYESERVSLIEPEFALVGEGVSLSGSSESPEPPASEGQEELLLVAARARSVSGRVMDTSGAPHEHATVEVSLDLGVLPAFATAMRWRFPVVAWSDDTDATGRFELGSIPILEGARIHATSGPFSTDPAPLPAQLEDELVFELRRERPEDALTLSGVVLHPDGTVAPRATVAFGEASALTDSEGAYALELFDVDEGASLYAVKSGYGIAEIAEYGAKVEGLHGQRTAPAVTLGEDSLAITGQLLDENGDPLEGWEVDLLDATEHEALEGHLENIAAGRTLGFVATDDSGSFVLDGLLDRTYRVRARNAPGSVVTSGPVSAGTAGHLLRFRRESTWDFVRGRVVTRFGNAVVGAHISVIGRAGEDTDGEISWRPGLSTRTGEGGVFELRGVPRNDTELFVGGPSVVPGRHAIFASDSPDDLQVIVPAMCRFRLELLAEDPTDRLELQTANGATMQFALLEAGEVHYVTSAERHGGEFSVVQVSDEAALVVLYADDQETLRIPLLLRPDELAIVRP